LSRKSKRRSFPHPIGRSIATLGSVASAAVEPIEKAAAKERQARQVAAIVGA
jgi:hypothetical protein